MGPSSHVAQSSNKKSEVIFSPVLQRKWIYYIVPFSVLGSLKNIKGVFNLCDLAAPGEYGQHWVDKSKRKSLEIKGARFMRFQP